MRSFRRFVFLFVAPALLLPASLSHAQSHRHAVGQLRTAQGQPGATVVAPMRGRRCTRGVTAVNVTVSLRFQPALYGQDRAHGLQPSRTRVCNSARARPCARHSPRGGCARRDRDGRGPVAADRDVGVAAVRQPGIAGGARAAGPASQSHEPDEPDARREREHDQRRSERRRADERCRRRRYGCHGRWHRSELESGSAIAFTVRRSESDLGDEPRLDRRGADRQGRAAGGVRRRGRRADQRDQPIRHERVPRVGVLRRTE